MKTKIIPFDAKMAKDIQDGKIKGRIIAKSKNGYLSVSLKQIDTISSTLNIYHGDSHVEVKYGHNSMLQYLEGCNILFIELPEETPICNNPDSPRCRVCSNRHCNDCQYNKHEFKPFDKVLVRVIEGGIWIPRLYGRKGITGYCTQDGCEYKQCIPYEGNEHLVGTTDKPKED